jgi:murein DD-endopeptidase MepM/ murein hydrolase activator NlpD
LGDVSERLQSTSARLDESRVEQRHVATELERAQHRLVSIRGQVRQRLRAIYLTGTGSWLTAMVRSQSVGDVVSRGFLMRTVAHKDQELFIAYQREANAVRVQKANQDRLVLQVSRLERTETAQRADLDDARMRQSHVLERLHLKEGELEETLAQFAVDEQNISAQIAAYARRPRAPGTSATPSLPEFRGSLSMPVAGRIGDRFGMRYHPILHITRMHSGVDLVAPAGTPIHAAAAGNVISTSYMRGYGNVVILDHGGGVSTVYAHCSRILCSAGERVSRGQEIAEVGSTGLATGPHCHFEVRMNGHAVDPLSHL